MLTPLDHDFLFLFFEIKIAISDHMDEFRRLGLRKSCSFTELQPQWLLLDRQREPRSLFKFWHLKGPDTIQNPQISPRPGKFILTTESLCCCPSHVPDGFLFLRTECLQRSRVHSLNFTLHFSSIYYDYSLGMLYVIVKICLLIKRLCEALIIKGCDYSSSRYFINF